MKKILVLLTFTIMSFTSTYAMIEYKFKIDKNFTPYLRGYIGYAPTENKSEYIDPKKESSEENFSKTDVNMKDGLYYGAGIGVEVNAINIELIYLTNQGEVGYSEDGIYKRDPVADYSRISLGIRYKF